MAAFGGPVRIRGDDPVGVGVSGLQTDDRDTEGLIRYRSRKRPFFAHRRTCGVTRPIPGGRAFAADPELVRRFAAPWIYLGSQGRAPFGDVARGKIADRRRERFNSKRSRG